MGIEFGIELEINLKTKLEIELKSLSVGLYGVKPDWPLAIRKDLERAQVGKVFCCLRKANYKAKLQVTFGGDSLVDR